MYNIFKRPMFKLGGMTQGTGIMSHVEPRPKYFSGGRIMAQGGYDPRGIYFGYGADPRGTYFGPSSTASTTLNPVNTVADIEALTGTGTGTGTGQQQSAFEKGQAARREAMNRAIKYGKYGVGAASAISQYGAGILGPVAPVLAGFGLGYGRGKLIDYRNQLLQDLEKTRTNQTSDEIIKPLTKETGLASTEEDLAFATGMGEQKIEKPKVNPPKYTETKTSKFNLLDEVKKESAELKELLKDEDYSKGELALVLSAALGKKGTIAEKIQEASKLALPLAKSRKEEDKAITLAAYKLAKEKEQQEIRAGTLPTSIREAEYIARSLKESGDPRYADMSVQEIMNENIRAARPMSPESKARTEVLLADRETIRDTTKNLLKTKSDLDKLDPIKDKAKYDKIKEMYDNTFKEFERNYLSVPEFKSLYESTYNIFAPQITSRTVKAEGGLTEDEKEPDVIASNINFGGTTTPVKPVQKLDYKTLRDRLPKEINDQVIQLLASSEQALQDFAYITSQNDVNNFNIKYGVNLIIPPAQQTS